MTKATDQTSAAHDFLREVKTGNYGTILADPPWRFTNRTGKVAPEHKRLNRYDTLSLKEIKEIPGCRCRSKSEPLISMGAKCPYSGRAGRDESVGVYVQDQYRVAQIRKDGGPDGRGVGFYFRNTTEVVLFGIRGKLRTLQPGRSQVNIMKSQKQEHSRKPDELYRIIEECSLGPYLELFARGGNPGWRVWGNQAEDYAPDWPTYKNHSQVIQQNRGHHPKKQVVFVS